MALRASIPDRHAPRADGEAAPPRPRLVAQAAGLEARRLGKRFKGRVVLRDVDLQVRRGEAVGLLGPNGAGKTTCFYIITGLLEADQGTVCLDGADITDLPMYRRARLGIGYLPQEASIFRGLSVEDNIRAVLEMVEPVAEQREAQLDQLLAEFSLSHLRRAPALALSGRRAAAGRDRPRAGLASRASSCSTSRSPASTRSTSATSASWSRISRTAASAC